jgi:hypothetical protein
MKAWEVDGWMNRTAAEAKAKAWERDRERKHTRRVG